ncbi:MarR family winged helix-turn-helix transcriptional regulator [Crossiella cryophila]|uniref:DNA-binding MarR family transcriptional regulator n=1 Tax=Crossiella cryophila TaxID=43355 RepID=A0A7W7FTN8_9PSEU|nr:MarR family transcriptional regulator [Crossiella cryophila]MBB4677407.1 DNA-binding MarR family transcriptional regulator [Crossiella cryophila]
MSLRQHDAFQLLAATKRWRRPLDSMLAEAGLSPGQDFLLDELWQEDGLCQSELVQRLGVEQPTVAKAVKRLEAAGFLRRGAHERDARKVRIWLTERGRAARPAVEAAWREAEVRLGEGLAEGERVELVRLLRRCFGGE